MSEIVKVRVNVIHKDQYIIEIDKSIMNDEWMKDFREDFTDIYTYEKHAENIAYQRSVFQGVFLEGYGLVKIDGEMLIPDDRNDYSGVNIIVVSEGEDIEMEVV